MSVLVSKRKESKWEASASYYLNIKEKNLIQLYEVSFDKTITVVDKNLIIADESP